MIQLLLGDSHAVRFQNFLESQNHSAAQILAAKGGITVEEGLHLIKSLNFPNDQAGTVFLSLGSNDILKHKYDPVVTHKVFRSVIRLIKYKIKPKHIYIFKIPLFPRMRHNDAMIRNINNFNSYMSTFNSDHIQSLNIQGITDRVTPKFFQQYYFNGKPDLIHLNDLGYTKVVQAISDAIN